MTAEDRDVLFVCTANQCRSPMAELLLRRRRPDLRIASAGTRATPAGLAAGARSALAAIGVDAGEHVSRRLDAGAIEAAGLVVGLAREHVREAAVLTPAALWKTFTLKELVRRGRSVGPRRSGETPGDWLRRVGAGRTTTDLLHHEPSDDVADPIGGPASGYAACVAELVDLIDELVALAFSA